MKKIIIGKNLEEEKAYCDFCKENEPKDCIVGSVREKHFKSKAVRTIEDFNYKYENKSFFGPVNIFKTFDDYKIESVYELIGDKERKIHICKDCIRQLAKLI